MLNLGALVGGTYSVGWGVNNAGQVAGESGNTISGVFHAFRYDGTPGSGGIMRDLGTLGGLHSYGLGVNNAGQVAGWSYTPNTDRAFRYDGTPGAGGVMRNLGSIPGGSNSYGYGINNAGQVVGWCFSSNGAPHAFRYDGTPGSGGVMRDLGTLGLGGGSSWCYGGINDLGQVTGYSILGDTSAYPSHAFRYDGTPGSGGIMRDLGNLGGTWAAGYAINDGGQVAGWGYITDNKALHAFLYTGTPGVDGLMIDLDEWLNANNASEGAKWTLSEASGISNTCWITGTGIYDPDGPGGVEPTERAYLLDASSLVPEPSGLALLALAVPALRRQRRHLNHLVCPSRRQIMRTILPALVLLVTLTPLMPSPALAAPPAFYDFTPSGVRSFGAAVNDAGQVTGTAAANAFRYDVAPGGGGVMHFLGDFGSDSIGMGINSAGQVAGYRASSDGSNTQAFRYEGTPGGDGVMHDLGTLGGGYSTGSDINDAGQVTGSSNIAGPGITFHAFRHDDGGMRDLGTLGGEESFGSRINNAGQVAGRSEITGSSIQHAFLYTGPPGAGGVMRDLGTLGGSNSFGNAINEAGQVAGSSQITGNTAWHAFLYTGTPGAGGVMRDLGTLGGTWSDGRAINDAGQVAGNSGTTGDAAYHAFLYTGTPGAGGQMIDLDDWLDANIPTEGAKWTLAGEGAGAEDINNTGWITGTGIYDPDGPGGVAAEYRAYLLDASSLVPEPSGLALLALAVPALLRRRRTSRRRHLVCPSWRQIMRTTVPALVLLASIMLAAPSASAAYITVYGGPTYTPSAGGFKGGGGIVNEAGIAVGSTSKYDSLGTWLGDRSFRWDASSATPTELGNLGANLSGYTTVTVSDINNAGTVVGEAQKFAASGATLGWRAVRWNASGTAAFELQNLGGDSAALAINNAGTAVGYSAGRAVRWNASGGLTELGNLGSASRAWAINEAGTAVGRAQKLESASVVNDRAVRWNASGTAATELGNLGTINGLGQTEARDINDAGTTVGWAHRWVQFTPNGAWAGYPHAVRWNASGTAAIELGNLASNDIESAADAINNAGTAIGYIGQYDSANQRETLHAVRWDASGTATELGNLGAGAGDAVDINNAGIAVGGVYSSSLGQRRAVYWGLDAVAVDLNTLIDPATGWTLTDAQHISDTGWIVGRGDFDPDGPGGQDPYQRMFLMQVPATAVPEPSGLALLALAVPALLRRRHQSRQRQATGAVI
jgi:probable HAF family extracellular repeat protein